MSCINCQRTQVKPRTGGRCAACASYVARHGVERPLTFNRFLAERQPSSAISTKEVSRRSGVSLRQLNYWVHCGYISPNTIGFGSGIHWWWPEETVALLSAVKTRVDWGMTPAGAFRLDAPPPLPSQKPTGEAQPGELARPIPEG